MRRRIDSDTQHRDERLALFDSQAGPEPTNAAADKTASPLRRQLAHHLEGLHEATDSGAGIGRASTGRGRIACALPVAARRGTESSHPGPRTSVSPHFLYFP